MLYAVWILVSIVVGYLGKDKKIGFTWALLLSLFLSPLIGLLVVLFSSKPQQHEYRAYYEKANKLEYLGKKEEARDAYKEALYHLERDYKGLSGSEDRERQKLLNEIMSKVDKLED